MMLLSLVVISKSSVVTMFLYTNVLFYRIFSDYDYFILLLVNILFQTIKAGKGSRDIAFAINMILLSFLLKEV